MMKVMQDNNGMSQNGSEEKSGDSGLKKAIKIMSKCINPKPVVGFSIGTVLLIVCVLLGWILVPKLIRNEISNKVQLRSGTELWEKWQDPPVPIYLKLYLFNVTNPEEVVEGRFPKLKEVGPFVYRERREKIDISEDPSRSLVKYKEKITYFFSPEKSGGLTESEELTILNIPYVAMSQKVSELTYPLDSLGISYIVKFKQKPFIRKTARDILFQGWKVPMVEELSELMGQELMPNSTFGLFYGKNGTDDGFIEVDSGLGNVHYFGTIKSWKGHTSLPWWTEGSHCNDILGTDGSLFPPFVTKNTTIRIFNAEICRSLHLTFSEETSFLGIPAFRFTAPKEMLEDPRRSEENKCYCAEEDLEADKCLGAGTLDLSSCRDGAPVAMSTPYFLDGFEGYQNDTGLTPRRQDHQTVLDIEPTTGIVLHAHKRIQINVALKPVPSIRSLRKMPEMLFPVVWADETAEIDQELAQQLKQGLLTPLITIEIVKWAVLGISILFILSSILRWISISPEDGNDEEEEEGGIIFKTKSGRTVHLKNSSNRNRDSVPFLIT